jgi:hypothetical protein
MAQVRAERGEMNDGNDDLHSNAVNREYWIYLRLAFLRDAKALTGKAQAIVERLAATTDDVPAQLCRSSSSSGTTPAGIILGRDSMNSKMSTMR